MAESISTVLCPPLSAYQHLKGSCRRPTVIRPVQKAVEEGRILVVSSAAQVETTLKMEPGG